MKTIFRIYTITFLFIILSYSHTLSQLNSPDLLFPYNNFQGVSIYAGFMWYPVSNANSYQIQVSEDSLFNTTVLDENNILINEFEISETPLSYNSNYFWRVKAANELYTSLWSQVWSFSTESSGYNGIVELISPSDNSYNLTLPILFSWESVANAEGYQIQVSTNPEFSNIVIDEISFETQFNSFDLDFSTSYYWKVLAFNESVTSDWSIVWSFTTAYDSISNFNIPLINGWNLISSNIIPSEPAMESVFEGMNNIVLVKNGAGQIFFPAFGLNQIGDWNIEAGYYVYTNSSSILNISGNEVNPLLNGIYLNAGWHLVSYLRNSAMNVQQALASITSNLIIAKNNLGGFYHPGFGINTLGEMQPGQAYWLYISSPALLTYPGN